MIETADPGRSHKTLFEPTWNGPLALAQRSRSGLTYQRRSKDAVLVFFGCSSVTGAVIGQPAGPEAAEAAREVALGLAAEPPTGPQAARVRTTRATDRSICKRPLTPVPPRAKEVPAVDRSCIGRLNSLFGLSFETVTALRGGHFAHRPCRDLVTAAALRPGT